MSDKEVKEKKEPDLSSALVCMKYTKASRILNDAMKLMVSECKPKAKIVDLCDKGDSYIKEQTSKVYRRTPEKGVAFPTCVSVNNTVCHFSPLADDKSVLEENDIVKIDMACQIDGFIAVLGHTHIITNGPVMGRAADVLAAANTAAEVAMRLVEPGNKKNVVAEAIQKVAVGYDCCVLGDIHCHKMKKSAIYGNKFVLNAPSGDTKVDDAEFEENEVYAIDITTSTGEGKPHLLDEKQTTIYKFSGYESSDMSDLGFSVLNDIMHMFPNMPFTARALDNDKDRSVLVNLVDANCLEAYPVLHEKPGDLVARVKFIVLLKPNGSERITAHPLQVLQSTKSVDEIAELLSLPVNDGGRKEKGKTAKTEDGAVGFIGNVPDEILFSGIFERLEPWWFFRCSSVTKKWRDLITSKDWLRQRHDRQRPRPVILNMTKDDKLFNSNNVKSFKIEIFDLQARKSCLIAKFSGVTPTRRHSFQMVNCFKVHGSCRGVLLISFHEHLYLCNPMTRHWARFDYVHRAGDMLCLYHHSVTDDYRVLRKVDSEAEGSCTYWVIELDPERSLLTQRQVCQRQFDLVVDPAPVQVGDCVYWVHVLNGNAAISVFNATSEKLSSIPVPHLAEGQVVTSIEVLEVNDQLAVSIACGSAYTTNLEGPSLIELWKYEENTWRFDLRVELPNYIKAYSDSYVHFGLGEAGWKGFITDGHGNALILVANRVVCCDKNGCVVKTIRVDDSTQELIPLRLMLKESLLSHRKLPNCYDVENLEPPFFDKLVSSEATMN